MKVDVFKEGDHYAQAVTSYLGVKQYELNRFEFGDPGFYFTFFKDGTLFRVEFLRDRAVLADDAERPVESFCYLDFDNEYALIVSIAFVVNKLMDQRTADKVVFKPGMQLYSVQWMRTEQDNEDEDPIFIRGYPCVCTNFKVLDIDDRNHVRLSGDRRRAITEFFAHRRNAVKHAHEQLEADNEHALQEVMQATERLTTIQRNLKKWVKAEDL